MIVCVLEAVVTSGVDEVLVVVGHDPDPVQEALAAYAVSFVTNAAYRNGMSTSIHAGVKAASSEAIGYMICLSDLPFITSDEYRALVLAFRTAYRQDERAIVTPSFAGQRGNPVLLSAAYRPVILAQQGVVGCRSIVKAHPDHVTVCEMPSDHILRDVDTPDVYRSITTLRDPNN
jgi:molybdenum cofactor cytidylyltransferase